ncbi:glycine oxidase ThiO [Sphaerisporangium rubeum]|uniref:Glycine oxidase n=1 Tax=Sphaerisporangium rubeum TaxID=321317 RepID=A0A7X0I8S1_9ACTN|nr:FAD-dependent oxidoreductase [Sphaerisporangium rubeum]MBB6470726.1 glycine oxidase [Sphaerisporangium rubeum]
MTRYDIAVIGAGVVGASTARLLADQGASVCVLDAGARGGRGSRAAAGVGVPSVRLLADPVMLGFAEAGRKQLLADLDELTGNDPGRLRTEAGVIRVVRTPQHREELETAAAGHPGYLGEWLEGERLTATEPLLSIAKIHGAYFDPTGLVMDADGYVTLLQQAAVAAGAQLRLGTQVFGVESSASGVQLRTQDGAIEADRVVVAAGAWSGAIPGLTPLPVRPLRGQMLRLDATVTLRHVVSGSVYAAPSRSGTVVVGATEENAGFAESVTPEGLLVLTAFLGRMLPRLASGTLRDAWSGLRATAPGGRPLIGTVPGDDRVIAATGHGGQGILTGGLTGRAVAGYLATGDDEWVRAFTPALERG